MLLGHFFSPIFPLATLAFISGLLFSSGSLAGSSVKEPAPIRFLLSFDDGPSAKQSNNPTEKILTSLLVNPIQPGIKALFFVQTRAINGGGTELGKRLLQREVEDGHLLAFHTSTPKHANHRFLTDLELENSLENGIADLKQLTGSAPSLVRPPFWNYDARTFDAYKKHGLRLLLTDLNANDGKIWGVNFSFSKRRNMLKQLKELLPQWQAGSLPVIDGNTPIVVTFHDINTYTANNIEEYLQILLDVAAELKITTAHKPFYDDKADIERAALSASVTDGKSKQHLPGLWNWLWQ